MSSFMGGTQAGHSATLENQGGNRRPSSVFQVPMCRIRLYLLSCSHLDGTLLVLDGV